MSVLSSAHSADKPQATSVEEILMWRKMRTREQRLEAWLEKEGSAASPKAEAATEHNGARVVQLSSQKRPLRGLAGLTEGKKELIQWE